MENFAQVYDSIMHDITHHPVDIQCRGRQMAYEVENVRLNIPARLGVSIYSHQDTRAFPITFALAEFAWILAKMNDVESIARFNKNIVNYSDDTIIMGGAYGKRLGDQISHAIDRMRADKHTRQACAVIWCEQDSFRTSKDHPCNIFLQFMIRNDKLSLTVTSRSSDLMTGLPIDAFHWQFLLHIVRNDLLGTYPSLEAGSVVYNITSLHVYDIDKPMLLSITDKRQTDIEDVSHMLYVPKYMTYANLSVRCVCGFCSCNNLNDLIDMFGFHEGYANELRNLHLKFINRKHKLERKGDKA